MTDELPLSLTDSLGGTRRLSAVALLSAPFPFSFLGESASSFGRIIAFINAGSVGNGDNSELIASGYSTNTTTQPASPSTAFISRKHDQKKYSPIRNFPFGNPRVSVGCGLSLGIGPAKCEITYSLPIMKAVTDDCRGFQLGFGLTLT